MDIKKSAIGDTLDITEEEMFCFGLSRGKTKTACFREIFECSGLSDNAVRVKAYKYSNQQHVVNLMNQMDDNSFIEHIHTRQRMLVVLADLAETAESDFVRADSANKFLTQTAKVAKLQVDVTVNNEAESLLNELRETLLTPHSICTAGKTAIYKNYKNNEKASAMYNSVSQLEKVSKSNLNGTAMKNYQDSQEVFLNETESINDDFLEGELVWEYSKVLLEGKVVGLDEWEEQVEGINPTYSKGTTNRDINTTGAFRHSKTGFFLGNSDAKRMLLVQELRPKVVDYNVPRIKIDWL